MYPHLALQLISTLILFTLPASHTSTNSDQFSTCSNLYSCGENIQGVGYPFWGDQRPQICGLQGFELTCGQENNFPTINMNTHNFSVLGIEESSHQMTLAHPDVDGMLCKQGSLYNTDLNDALFAYNRDDVGFVKVYYNCPSDIDTSTSSYSEVKRCDDKGSLPDSILTLDVVPGLERCTSNITVPVLNSAILELTNNTSFEQKPAMELRDVFMQGFSVNYKIDETYCSACKNSGGLCWSGTDETQKTCLCKDGANASVCTTPSKGVPSNGSKGKIDGGARSNYGGKIGIEQSDPPISPPPQEQSDPTISPPPQEQSHPTISPPPQGVPSNGSEGKIDGGARSNYGVKIGIGVGAALIGILLICFIYCIIKFSNTPVTFLRRKTKNDREVEDFVRQYGSSITKRYTYHEVKNMTNSFKHELGKGGYGNVFKGKLLDGRDVAVKVLNVSKGKGEEFINEVASIGRTSHVNVVTLLGFCYEGRRRALIYEFMPNGSLEKFIYAKISLTAGQHLGWEKLYDIALGIARGLNYLHRGCNTRIVHFDIKPHNILLDENFCPKISDFGLAKLCTRKESIISTIEARGTIGYIAPEVFSRNFGGVSHKSDVYSYGMMVLEMVGGRKNVDVGVVHASEIYFPHWIYKRIKVDEELSMASEMTVEENVIARKMVIIGLWCIQMDPSQRPSISKVIEMLEGSILALEIPPQPYLCSPRRSASNSSPKAVSNSPPGLELNSFTTSN